MDRNDCSRRDFLKKFAALSSASLLFGVTVGCSSGTPGALYGPGPLYGPPPITDPMVSGIYFVDAAANLVSLYDYQFVPIDKKFLFTFTTNMDTSALVTVTLTDGSSNPVALNAPIWEDAHSLSVMPSAALLNNTNYTLSLTDATDSTGKKVIINADATASFKTA